MPADLKCERCGRGAGGIAGCPDRPSGGCPFIKQGLRWNPAFLLAGGLLYICLVASFGLWLNNGWWLIGLGFVTVWALYVEAHFYNSNRQVLLKRATLAGLEIFHRWTPRSKLLPTRLEPSQSLTYPLSITALAASPTGLDVNAKQAANLFRAALIGLLASEQIQVHQLQSWVFRMGQASPSIVDDYILVTALKSVRAAESGCLEADIVVAIKSWEARSEARGGSEGPRIYDLVREVFGADRMNAPRWLAERVAKDAVSRGIGQFHRRSFILQMDWDPVHMDQLQGQQQIGLELSQQLARRQASFSSALDKQISKAIKSREHKID